MSDLFVYYRVAKTDVDRLLRILTAWPEVRAVRHGDPDNAVQIWMEVHSGPFAGQTEAALARALETLIIGRRHTECFVPLQPSEIEKRLDARVGGLPPAVRR